MNSVACAGCQRRFSHAGYSRHLSMTTRTLCRAIYESYKDSPAAYGPPYGPPGFSGTAPTGDEDPGEHFR